MGISQKYIGYKLGFLMFNGNDSHESLVNSSGGYDSRAFVELVLQRDFPQKRILFLLQPGNFKNKFDYYEYDYEYIDWSLTFIYHS